MFTLRNRYRINRAFRLSPQDDVNRIEKLPMPERAAQSIFTLDSCFDDSESEKAFLQCICRGGIAAIRPVDATEPRMSVA
ncbi:hypothetical protein GCM10022404_07420 [Celeribacter arenosi]|uniref:Uncharacterized protein n=1 Tax=Celeribacter arenosi TaxID=792649 RepID=A0ABP7JYD2_9RHOB